MLPGYMIDHLSPYWYATTPPQVIRSILISHELQLARKKQLALDRCAPLVDAATSIGYALRLEFSAFSVLLPAEGGPIRFFLEPALNVFILVFYSPGNRSPGNVSSPATGGGGTIGSPV